MDNITSTALDMTTLYITFPEKNATSFPLKSKTLQDLSDLQSTSTSQNSTTVYHQTTIPADVALCSVQEFLTCWLIPVSSVLSLISILGNAATITNVLRRRMYETGTYVCILLLAVSDLVSTVLIYILMFILSPMMNELYFNIPLCVLFFWIGFTSHFWSGSNLDHKPIKISNFSFEASSGQDIAAYFVHFVRLVHCICRYFIVYQILSRIPPDHVLLRFHRRSIFLYNYRNAAIFTLL